MVDKFLLCEPPSQDSTSELLKQFPSPLGWREIARTTGNAFTIFQLSAMPVFVADDPVVCYGIVVYGHCALWRTLDFNGARARPIILERHPVNKVIVLFGDTVEEISSQRPTETIYTLGLSTLCVFASLRNGPPRPPRLRNGTGSPEYPGLRCFQSHHAYFRPLES